MKLLLMKKMRKIKLSFLKVVMKLMMKIIIIYILEVIKEKENGKKLIDCLKIMSVKILCFLFHKVVVSVFFVWN